MNITKKLVVRIAIYLADGRVLRINGDWTPIELSLLYPVSKNGLDLLLRDIPEAERDGATVEFYDHQGRVIFPDPRIYLEDLQYPEDPEYFDDLE